MRETAILTTLPQVVRPTSPPLIGEDWQAALRDAIRSPDELCDLLGLPHELAVSAGDFPLLVPRGFAARMRPADPSDPLLRQVLPMAAEQQPVEGYVADPVGDLAAVASPGLLHKYNGRVLLVLTGACAVNCRYCFRRHYPYATSSASPRRWQLAVETIAADSSIEEVILSGGDPLMQSDGLLAELTGTLEGIDHLRRLRIHTRLPIVIPERVTESLFELLHSTRLNPVIVVHANHANELDGQVSEAMQRFTRSGAMVLNQAVLLRGVNDSVRALRDLSQRLLELKVMPYYLHQLDRVAGAAHFEVPLDEGLELMGKLRAELPGYAVPRYVQEIASEPNKRVLA